MLVGDRDELQHAAPAAGRIEPAIRAKQPGAGGRRAPLTHTRAVDIPALAADLSEGPGKGRSHRAHQVVNLERRTLPVDSSVLRSAPPEVLPRLHALRTTRCAAIDETGERAGEDELGSNRHLGEHLPRVVIYQDGHAHLVDDIAGVR